MDTVKIGKYIAGKRKALGMTQAQVAEKLGMSDKSVSKWERGICLPDVSVYMALCEILGISLNEFIAGEDIEPAEVLQKSEENLIQVTEDAVPSPTVERGPQPRHAGHGVRRQWTAGPQPAGKRTARRRAAHHRGAP